MMGYRFYTSQEFARLRVIKEREERQRLRETGVVKKMATPIQTQLAAVIHLVPNERQHLAQMYMRLRNASPKQLAACKRWVERVENGTWTGS